jgi:hypothetical protein
MPASLGKKGSIWGTCFTFAVGVIGLIIFYAWVFTSIRNIKEQPEDSTAKRAILGVESAARRMRVSGSCDCLAGGVSTAGVGSNKIGQRTDG